MFTGLVEDIGEVIEVRDNGELAQLVIASNTVTEGTAHGDSIAVSGVCLTVVDQSVLSDGRRTFTADVMQPSLRRTTLGSIQAGDRVNLERAARADARLGGHIVQGHVEEVATIVSVSDHPEWRVLRFEVTPRVSSLLIAQGSITVGGVSLTVSALSPLPADASESAPHVHWFEVSLIPETLQATVLGQLAVGDQVNLETDLLARHVERLLAAGAGHTSIGAAE